MNSMEQQDKNYEKRFSIFPIKYNDLWEKYKKVEAQFWRVEDGDLSSDDFESLHQSQKDYLKMLLCFFAVSDSVVAENLALNFLQEDIPEEAKFFYSYQLMNENIHNITYSNLIEKYIKDEKEKDQAFNAVTQIPTVAKKMNWAYKWITNGSFEEKLVAFSAIEAISFSGTFCSVFLLKDLKLHLPGLYWANIEISRDEGSHYDFSIYYYNKYVSNKLSVDRVKEIILEAYQIELQFIHDSFVYNPIGFNKDKMIQYVQYVTDTVLINYGIEPEFKVEQPFRFMDQIAISRRANFFEGRVAEYGSISNSKIDIDLNLDF